MAMQRFNIALLPTDPSFQRKALALAHACFSEQADGYLLTEKEGLAHITLCQFCAPSQEEARAPFFSFPQRQESLFLSLDTFRFRPGKGEHEGFYWAEFLVRPSPQLMALQKACVAHLIEKGLQPLTAPQTYSPHLSLARIKHTQNVFPGPNDLTEEKVLETRCALGASTENGLLTKEIAL